MRYYDTQRASMDAIASRSEPAEHGLMVYHRQDGRRRFCVSPWESFATKYLALHKDHRHFHELIREETPAKLHVDIDVLLQENVQFSYLSRVEALIKAINNGLKILFDVDITQDQVLRMDSSRPEKFSQHLVFPTVVFANNLQCGYFLKRLADSARDALDNQ